MSKNLIDIEEATYQEDDCDEVPPTDIVAYNELRSCADLFRMQTKGMLDIKPEFQREVVWKKPAQTRFIDSLMKGLPIPSMCFSFDHKTQKWQVIDGLQRMYTIIAFLSGSIGTLSKLNDIDQRISGQPFYKFEGVDSELYSYLTRVENLTLPITVLRCDYSKRSHMEYLFTIFHRLNAGGMKLNNQEIRNCIFSGSFNRLLNELNDTSSWLKINRIKKSVGHRFTKQELILRFFAFYDSYNNYDGKLARFLNYYMEDNRNPSDEFLANKKEIFQQTVDVLNVNIFQGKVPPKLGITVLEALLLGVAFNLRTIRKKSDSEINAMYFKILHHEEFSENKLMEGISQKSRVQGRIKAAKQIFSGK